MRHAPGTAGYYRGQSEVFVSGKENLSFCAPPATAVPGLPSTTPSLRSKRTTHAVADSRSMDARALLGTNSEKGSQRLSGPDSPRRTSGDAGVATLRVGRLACRGVTGCWPTCGSNLPCRFRANVTLHQLWHCVQRIGYDMACSQLLSLRTGDFHPFGREMMDNTNIASEVS